MRSHGSNPVAGAGGLSHPPAPFFPGFVPDMIRVPPDAEAALSALGRERGLFGRIGDWPALADHLARLSADRLATAGAEEWALVGGGRDEDGRPTFKENSTGMQVALRELAADPGGFRYSDAEGVDWAVRLVPVGGRQPGFVGFAVTLNPAAASGLWLSERAEQLLWLIMGAAPAGSGVFTLPDKMLAGAVWGGGNLPKDWRGDLSQILRSLMRLHSAVIRFGGSQLVPRFRAESVALAHFADLGTEPKSCPPGCPMGGRGRHGHFELQLCHGFAPTLARFTGGTDAVPVHLPTQVFGPSCRCTVTARQRGLVTGLLRELTRNGPRRPAEVIGRTVPGPRGDSTVVCPLLNENGRYVVFGGNAPRAGLGYRLVGETGGGWLARCGFLPQVDTDDAIAHLRCFLADLAAVANRIGLIAAAIDPNTGEWLSLADLRRAAATRHGAARLHRVHLRVYGPTDYLARLRGYYASECGFSVIPASAAELAATVPNTGDAAELAMQLRELGMKQTELAGALGISQPMVSKVLAGTKLLSAPLAARARTLLSGRSSRALDGKEV